MATKKKYLSTECRKAIRKMIAYALAHPMQVNQNRFPEGCSVEQVCNSDFCSAGHGVIANNPALFSRLVKRIGYVNWYSAASKSLALPKDANTESLFSTFGYWPKKYRDAIIRAEKLKTARGTQNAFARTFAARWQEIIDTDGAEINPSTEQAYKEKYTYV